MLCNFIGLVLSFPGLYSCPDFFKSHDPKQCLLEKLIQSLISQ